MAGAQYANGDPPIVSTQKQLVFDLEAETSIYIDSMGKVRKPADILSKHFVPMASVPFRKKIPRRLSEVSFYYRFNIQNPDTGMARLYFYPGMYHSDMDLFYLSDTGLVREKDINPREGFVSLQIPSGIQREYYLCLTLTRSDNNTLSSRLIRPSYLDDYVRQLNTYAYNRKLVGFVTCGVLIMMLIFCVLNYISNRKPEYLYNALFSIFMFMIIFAYAQYYNKPGRAFGEFFGYWWLILLHIGYMCYIQFSRKFLDTANKDKVIDRLFRFEIAALLVLMLAYSFVHFFTKEVKWDYYLEILMKITVVGISIIYVIMGLKNKDRLMNYLAIGSAFNVMFAFIALWLQTQSASSTRVLSSSIFYFELGIIFSQFFFLLGLTYKNRVALIDEIKYKEALRMNQEKAAYEQQLAIYKAQQSERNRISTDMHDDLGAGMTTIRLYSELAKKKIGSQHIPEIEKISNAANELLVKMNGIIWSMTDSNDNLDNAIAYIRSYALEYLENAGIRCVVHIPERLPRFVLNGELRRNIFLIVKEALNNIVKHSGATEVHISLNKEPHGLSLTIHDNGKGFDEQNIRRFGNGLQNMKKRMAEFGGEFSISNQNGTLIRLYKQTRD